MKRRYPFRRGRRTKRRRTYRKKFTARRKRARSSVLNVARTLYDGAWTFGTAGITDFWRYQAYTAATHIQEFSTLALLYDEYKINRIKVTFRPRYDSVANATAAATQVAQPQAYAHIIMDQASTLTPSGTYVAATVNKFLENGKVRSYTLNRPFTVYFKPKVADTVGAGTSYVWPRWFQTSDSGVNHRGYHMFLQQNNLDNSNVNIKLDAFVTVYAQFRNPK